VPETEVVARSKGEIALGQVGWLIAPGIRFGVVLADAGYGTCAAFRHGLSELGLAWRLASRGRAMRSGWW
jgi:SRSO17 transposase